jgi:hypothetical protein
MMFLQVISTIFFYLSVDAVGTQGRGCEGPMEPVLICVQIHCWRPCFIVLCSHPNLHVVERLGCAQGTTNLGEFESASFTL